MLRSVPLIVILGSTGTGKTKLSIELAKKFGAEIISADSMQVYKGLDIVTAKATKTEQSLAKHHLLDIVDAGRKFTVVDFRDEALPIIENLLDAKTIPILVGGTNYYIESILWKVLVNPPRNDLKRKGDPLGDSDDDSITTSTECVTDKLDGQTSTELHKRLQSVDPESAQRLHPNDIRKVKRALEVYEMCGKTMTDILNEQKSIPGGNDYGGPLRFEHIIMFWLQCDQEILNKRLDARIDGMLSQGLIREIRSFFNSFNNVAAEYTKGALQSIGLKEFIPYLEKYDEQEDDRVIEYLKSDKVTEGESPPESLMLLRSCLETLRLVTKRYSRNQPKWIRNRLIRSDSRQVPPIYALSTSNPNNWNEDVYLKAESVVQSYIDNVDVDLIPCEPLSNPMWNLNVTNHCETCNRPFVGEFQFHLHLQSNKHKRQVAKEKKRKYLEESAVTKKDVSEIV